MTQQTDDLRISDIQEVVAPEALHAELSITDAAANTVVQARDGVKAALHGRDDRLVVITGPCSIHDIDAAMEYAGRLQSLRAELDDALVVIMRVYFEKPRTTVGWKGLINDPNLDDSFEINKGLKMARKLLLDLNDMGIPAGTEYLDLISPQYVSDLISWGAIGARTTESQGHRELSSGLSCPVGFKNGTDGNVKIAIDAIGAASRPHHFLSMTKAGKSAIFGTKGNEDCHVILRGGKEPNYDAESVNSVYQKLQDADVNAKVMVDFSHGNSRKQYDRQPIVCRDIARQIADGSEAVFGVMIESHLVEGNQSAKPGQSLNYGQSITDACVSWDTTVAMLNELADAVRERRSKKAATTANAA